MLQIIGWLGCLMLAVKLVELGHSKALRNEEGRLPDFVMTFLIASWFGVVGFAIWIFAQGQAIDDYQAEMSDYEKEVQAHIECIEAAGSDYDAMLKC